MQVKVPDHVLKIYNALEEKEFSTYFVGGCIRNLLMRRKVKDWDLATNATPEQILSVFPDAFYDNTFGTVGIPFEEKDEKHVVEVTTFRSEEGYGDRRHPEKITWGKTIEEDLGRRDFTINAIAAKLANGEFAYIDPYNGRGDIEEKIIKAVGDPNERFKEDALRLLRAIRIATEASLTIGEETWIALTQDASLIQHTSGERIRQELIRILASDHPYEGVILLKNSNLLSFIIPELLEGIDVSQVRPGRHHTTDVFSHNILSLKFCPSTDPIVRFATLLHDVGKPRVAAKDNQGYVIFHNHELVGAKIAREICDRLKFSKKERDKIVNLIRWHMFTVDEHITDAAVRRFIRRVGVENVEDMIDLRIGDRLGGGTQVAESWRLKHFKKRIEQELQPAPFSINDLAIDGNDVMRELRIPPGPRIGEILQKLFEEVDEDLSKNTKEYLVKQLKELPFAS